jgi:hypothetical protein
VIDPITAYLGQTDAHHQASVRRLMDQLRLLAHNHCAAVLAIAHLNKRATRSQPITTPLHRPQGSIAFAAVARSVLALAIDPHDSHTNCPRRLLGPLKQNLSDPAPTLAFRITDADPDGRAAPGSGAGLSERQESHEDGRPSRPYPLPTPHDPSSLPPAARVIWEPNPIEANLATLLHTRPSALARACDFLRTQLAHGPRSATDLELAARTVGLSPAILRRAKNHLGVRSVRRNLELIRGTGCWTWEITYPATDAQGD